MLPDLGGQLVAHLSLRGNKNGAYYKNAFEPHDDCVPPSHCGGEYRGGWACVEFPVHWSWLKEGLEVALAIEKATHILKTVIGLDTLNSNAFEGKMRNDNVQKVCASKRTLFLISVQDAIAGILVSDSVLI